MHDIYEHNLLMAELKKVDETIKENYSSSQLMEVWDKLLYNALEPIVMFTNVVQNILADVLHFLMDNHKRKISAIPRDEVLTLIFLFFAEPPHKKLGILKAMRLERNLLKLIIETFLTATQNYSKLLLNAQNNNSARLRKKISTIENAISLSKDADLFCKINTVNFWFSEAMKFKSMILEKYYRMLVTDAQNLYALNLDKLSLDDVIQNYFVFASKALDKYDSNEGTLTSYIKTWLHHAKKISLQVSEQAQFEQLSDTMIDDALDATEFNLDSLAEQKKVQQLAKIVDPTGLGRISLGISEYLTEAERVLLVRI